MALTSNEHLALRIRLEQLLGAVLPASDLPAGLAKAEAVLATCPVSDEAPMTAADVQTAVAEATALVELESQGLRAENDTLRSDLARAAARILELEAALAAATAPAPVPTDQTQPPAGDTPPAQP